MQLTKFLRPVEVRHSLPIPVFLTGIRAGFPSPADDFSEKRLDLNQLIEHPEATFYAYAEGDSMQGLGIDDGDLLVVDKALLADVGDIVVAEIEGGFTVKRLGRGVLLSANPAFPPIAIDPQQGVQIWGVVRHVIKDVRARRPRRVKV